MQIQTLQDHLESFSFSESNDDNDLSPYKNIWICAKIETLLHYNEKSKITLADFLDKEILEKEDFYEIIHIYLNDFYVSELIPISKKIDINDFITYWINKFWFDDKLWYHNVLYTIEKDNKDNYLKWEISDENLNILYPVKDVNLYLDKIRNKNKKYNLKLEDDYLEIYEIIKNVSFFNITDYKEKEYCITYNEWFYDKFNTSLSLENYKFLYENYYKYNEDYLHQLYFSIHNVEWEYCLWDWYTWSKSSYLENHLALEIQWDFVEILSEIDIKSQHIDEKLLKFIIQNTKNINWRDYLEKAELIDGNDIITLRALKNTYMRTGDLEKMKAIKNLWK